MKYPFDCDHHFTTPTITDPATYGRDYATSEPRCEVCGCTMSELYEEATRMTDRDDDRGLDLDIDVDRQVGYHLGCGGIVREYVYSGHRPYMARFAEPDEVEWRCECGEECYEEDVTPDEG